MKFSADPIDRDHRVTAVEPGRIRVGEIWYEHSLLLQAERPPRPWPVAGFEALTAQALGALAEPCPEVLLLGTGTRQRFPTPVLLRPLVEAGVGFEVMDTAAACRTYNILLSEGRRVLAALLV